MNPVSWEQLGPQLSAPFASSACETGFGNKMMTASPDLFAAVDDYSRANGVTDDLLEQLSPMASGDTILLVTMAGRPPQAIGDGVSASSPPSGAMSMRGGRRGGAGMSPTSTHSAQGRMDRSAFEVSATLYSVRLRRSVAVVAMTYSGASVDDALKSFTKKLRDEMPGSTCSGWKWDAPVEESRVRKLMDE